jgi:hypothetical protein
MLPKVLHSRNLEILILDECKVSKYGKTVLGK